MSLTYSNPLTLIPAYDAYPVYDKPNVATLRHCFVPPVPPKTSILKPPPQPDPVSVNSSPSIDMSQMPPEVQALVSSWRAGTITRGRTTDDYYPTAEENARRDAKDTERARRVQAGEFVSLTPRQPTTTARSMTDMMHGLEESFTGRSKNSSPHRPQVPPIDIILPPGMPGTGLGLGIVSADVANLNREAEDYQWDARSQKLVQTSRASPFDIEIVPVRPIFSLHLPSADGRAIAQDQSEERE